MRKTKELAFSYGFLMPSLALTLVLGIYPIAWAMRYMFYDYKGYGKQTFIGLDNFARVMRDGEFWHAVSNTFVYAGGKLALSIPFALLLAVVLNRGLRGRQILRAVFFLPTIVSTAVMAVVFFAIFNAYNGVLNQFLLKYKLIGGAVDWLGADHAMMTVVLVSVWGAVGNYMLLFIAGLQNIPADVYESASLDGANKLQQFRYVTVPMLGPVMQMIVMLAIINALKGYESIMVLTDGGPIGKTNVMFLYVYKLFFPTAGTGAASQIQEIGYGSAVAFVTAIIVGLITLLYYFGSKRMNRYA
ncbi:ABC-type sugar transport system, permease component [Cohnella sp. OV330]|uniref:carbohydrate ABC transporter permease n=1 Tax=Cohnella sp. OV330 TaxID=1855288 RepID=UPI0008E4C234|nr:sugar ABC transporter permease [Cohnella sp. OV330]SFB14218.1 ABC-type sugar transport system, permease component [Cohnella sp. OV330]